MDWSNEMVLEFLQVFGTEPIIWNPKHPEHKKKHLVADAWRRIYNTLNWQCNIEDLKKKRDSLMIYYRYHLNRIRKLKISGTGTEEDYRTNWFAFETMNSFLRTIYDCTILYNAEPEDMTTETSRQLTESADSAHGSEYLSDLEYQPKRKCREPQEVVVERVTTRADKGLNECEMFVHLLEHKLMKLEEDDRLVLMNKIDNLVFQTTMEVKKRRKSARTNALNISSTNQTQYTISAEQSHSETPCHYDYNRDIPSPTYRSSPPQSLAEARSSNLTANSTHFNPNPIGSSQLSESNLIVKIKKEM